MWMSHVLSIIYTALLFLSPPHRQVSILLHRNQLFVRRCQSHAWFMSAIVVDYMPVWLQGGGQMEGEGGIPREDTQVFRIDKPNLEKRGGRGGQCEMAVDWLLLKKQTKKKPNSASNASLSAPLSPDTASILLFVGHVRWRQIGWWTIFNVYWRWIPLFFNYLPAFRDKSVSEKCLFCSGVSACA